MRIFLGIVFLTFTSLLAGNSLCSAQKQVPPENGVENPFLNKVIAIVTQTKGARTDRGGGYFENVIIQKIGDNYFIVGQYIDITDENKIITGHKVWTQVSDIISITEFKNIDELKKVYGERRKND